jgi:hypothetical protein
MATAEAALRELLISGSPTLCAGRVYPRILPQSVLYPAISFFRVSTDRSQYRDVVTGRAGYARPRMQVDVWALSQANATTIAQDIRLMLEGFSGTAAGLRIDMISIEDEGNADIEPDLGAGGVPIYGHRLDLFVYHPEE